MHARSHMRHGVEQALSYIPVLKMQKVCVEWALFVDRTQHAHNISPIQQ